MIIWNRWGFLVAVITFACLLAAEAIVESYFADEKFYQSHRWPMSVAFIAAAVILAVVSPFIHRRERRALLDPETGREVVLGQSSFFFVPMKYWAPILLLIGVAVLFV